MIFIVACCHGAKLCAHAARDFRSQQYICSIALLTLDWLLVYAGFSFISGSCHQKKTTPSIAKVNSAKNVPIITQVYWNFSDTQTRFSTTLHLLSRSPDHKKWRVEVKKNFASKSNTIPPKNACVRHRWDTKNSENPQVSFGALLVCTRATLCCVRSLQMYM